MSDQPPRWGTGDNGGQGGGQSPSATGVIIASVIGIFFCLPLGIPALVYAINASNKSSEGNFAGARQDLSTAKKWVIAAIALGLLLPVLVIIIVTILGGAAANQLEGLGSTAY